MKNNKNYIRIYNIKKDEKFIYQIILEDNKNFLWEEENHENILRYINQNYFNTFVLVNNNIIIAFITFDINKDNNIAQIELLAVKKEFRNNGYAKKLINFVISYLSYKNIDQIYINVQINNLAAKSLYQKFGFEFFEQELTPKTLRAKLNLDKYKNLISI